MEEASTLTTSVRAAMAVATSLAAVAPVRARLDGAGLMVRVAQPALHDRLVRVLLSVDAEYVVGDRRESIPLRRDVA